MSYVCANATNTSSSFSVIMGDLVFDALPLGWDERGIGGVLKRFSTTTYQLYDEDRKYRSTVDYDGKSDSITIQKGNEVLHTETSFFSPHRFTFNGKDYKIIEKVTGVIAIYCGGEMVAMGKCTFRSVVFKEHPEELSPILPEIATGFLIKMVLWSLFL